MNCFPIIFALIPKVFRAMRASIVSQWRRSRPLLFSSSKYSSISSAVSTQQSSGTVSVGKPRASKLREKLAERDLFLSVLSATTTKREAKSYIARFKPNTGGSKKGIKDEFANVQLPFHIALVKLRAPQLLENKTLQGIAHTLSQLDRLGLSCVIVLDCEVEVNGQISPTWRDDAVAQADRLVSALEAEKSVKARRLDYVMGIQDETTQNVSTVALQGRVQVQYPHILEESLEKGTIPVIPSIGYTNLSQQMTFIQPDEVVLALTRQFSGLQPIMNATTRDMSSSATMAKSKQRPFNTFIIDRVILLDPLGGIPSATRPDGSHIFINMEQEYEDIRAELFSANGTQPTYSAAVTSVEPTNTKFSLFGASNPFSKFLEAENPLETSMYSNPNASENRGQLTNRNVLNLDLLQKSLALLPASSSALLATPNEAATMDIEEALTNTDLGVITRRPKNPLIYNLLTDKPLVSSSLPVSRLGPKNDQESGFSQANKSTFVKRGMPLSMIPNPRVHVWEAPHPSVPQLSLEDARVDLPRLLNLIEDSFNRPLNVKHYLDRIRNKIAGVIVAGEYEGGAILTWELPPDVPDDGSEESRQRMVPYLDKFAVLKRSQGAGGVADIVFSAMVRSCFPYGVCWRSRKDNPVNKWYFERSVGTWKLPDTNWTMFWTTEGLYENNTRFQDYEGVCRSVLPSWADNPKVVD